MAGQQDHATALTAAGPTPDSRQAAPRGQPLTPAAWRELLAGPALEVAPRLLGAVLRHERPEGVVELRLTEVEAYGGVGQDPGSHAFRGPGRRNATMFGVPGLLYVYFTYGMHFCANVVCGPQGEGSAVLLRAGEVLSGLELARRRRPTARSDAELARGPARLTQALGLGREHDGMDLLAEGAALTLSGASCPPGPDRLSAGPRVGVAGPGGDAAAFPWRFWLTGDATVSVYRPGKLRRPRPAEKGTSTP